MRSDPFLAPVQGDVNEEWLKRFEMYSTGTFLSQLRYMSVS
ncbi:hypothetical protein WEIDD23_00406 [Weissella sp. DD23]|nr:hypothetical protein WEIDD23_00406 [Weissella sp. DD23]